VPQFLGGAGVAGVICAIIGTFVGGAIGAAIGWVLAADSDSFYARELKSGRTVLTVWGDRSGEAAAILRRHQAFEVSAREFSPARGPA
jgi:hypothetical protein